MTHTDTLLHLLADGRVHRQAEIAAAGVPSVVVKRAVERGVIARVESFLDDIVIGYALPDIEVNTTEARLAAVAVRHPSAVLCLQTCLRLYDLTTKTAEAWTAAIPPSANRRTKVSGVRLIQWADPKMFEVGVETRLVLDQPIRITDPCRTVLDLFRPAHDWSMDEAYNALTTVVVTRGGGVEAIDRIFQYAAALGWTQHVAQALTATQKMLQKVTPCANVTPKL